MTDRESRGRENARGPAGRVRPSFLKVVFGTAQSLHQRVEQVEAECDALAGLLLSASVVPDADLAVAGLLVFADADLNLLAGRLADRKHRPDLSDAVEC